MSAMIIAERVKIGALYNRPCLVKGPVVLLGDGGHEYLTK
jgi:hypothetical protein